MKMARPGRGRKTTIYDIAVAAHSSPAAVSLVLNDSWQRYRIKQETATRILNGAERLGYAVNLKARGLRLSRSGLAGMILPHYRNRFFAGLAEAFEAEARSRGLCPIVVSTH
ncbi:MAG TPA: LacI family DNA-binding transcriptional regulator, partial [Aestuariivirga sp.]